MFKSPPSFFRLLRIECELLSIPKFLLILMLRQGLRIGIRKYSSIKFPQEFKTANNEKPTLSQFRNPLFHTFLIASSTYMLIHLFVSVSEYESEEKVLLKQEKDLESEIQSLIDVKAAQVPKKRWYFFWRS